MNDYFRYTQNLLPGGIARSQPITQSFDAINRAFDLLPNPITDGKTRGFSQPLQVAPGQKSTDAVTLGQMLTAIADQASIDVDVSVVQQAVDDAINANAEAQSATQAAQGILTYLLEHQETAPLLGLAIGAVNINADGELLITVKNPDQAITVETLEPGQQADAAVIQDGENPSYLLLRIPKGDTGDITSELSQARDEAVAASTNAQESRDTAQAAEFSALQAESNTRALQVSTSQLRDESQAFRNDAQQARDISITVAGDTFGGVLNADWESYFQANRPDVDLGGLETSGAFLDETAPPIRMSLASGNTNTDLGGIN